MRTLKIVGGIAVVFVFAVFFLSIASEEVTTTSPKVVEASEKLGVPPEVIVEDKTDNLLLEDIIDDIVNEPDFVVDDVEFHIDPDDDLEISQNQLQITRTFVYNDGSIDYEVINNLQLNPSVLDFVSDTETLKPLDKGTLKLKISMPIEKQVESGDGEFFVFFDDNLLFERVDTSYVSFDGSDIIDGSVEIVEFVYPIESLMKDRPEGINKLNLRLERFVTVNEDGTKSYANPNEIIYSVELEKNVAQTVTVNENGEYVKTYDFDAPISITSKESTASETLCLSSCRGGGCCSTYTKLTKIPAPYLSNVKITDVETGKVVASDTLNGVCTNYETDYRVDTNTSLSTCLATTGSDSLVYDGQRTKSYRITIDSPKADFTVDVPESGGQFNYHCYEKRTLKYLYTNRYGTDIFTVAKEIICNFPIQ